MEVTDSAVKSKKEKVQEEVLDTAVRLKAKYDICKAAVVKVFMVL